LGRPLRREHVDPGPLRQGELVAAEGGCQRGRTVESTLGKHRPELAHEHAERLVPGRRRCVAPEHIGELVPGHGSSVRDDERGEEETALPSREVSLVEHHALRFDGDPA
jgi:hypothetical protein